MHAPAQVTLEALGQRLIAHGYRFRAQPVFAGTGIFVHSTPGDAGDGIATFDRSVFLYAVDARWEARVTLHGGRHWVHRAEDLDTLEQLALQALQSARRPPSNDWHPLPATAVP